jgi:transcriptional regulator with XRE-family HTH domain
LGDLLKFLRRARLTQRELSIAVGYSEAQISRLEQNQRPPDLAALTALFIPALYIDDEPLIVTRLMELAAQARGERLPQSGIVTFSRSVQREVRENIRTVEEGVLNNLPLQLTSFIGRAHEITEIKNLLDFNNGKARLVTLTGSGDAETERDKLASEPFPISLCPYHH